MTDNVSVTDFPSDEMVIRRLVRAIQKAIEEDIRSFAEKTVWRQ